MTHAVGKDATASPQQPTTGPYMCLSYDALAADGPTTWGPDAFDPAASVPAEGVAAIEPEIRTARRRALA